MMKKVYAFILMFLFLGVAGVFAQEINVSGTVISADDNSTLPGVTVLLKGTTNGTTTNIDGKYTLNNVPADGILVFSFVGMVTQEIPISNQTQINAVLETETFGLDEVVVIGYGTVKKQDVTGAVSVLGSESIQQIKPVKAEEALQGTVSGVSVTPQSGAPGAGLDIRIRGISTNGDPSPVVIIDGYVGDLNTINPNDIESFTVLKDAQAAIYGTIGANGVILITTKSGKKNTATQVNFNSSFGIQETTRMLPVLNATEYAVLLNESYAANAQDLPYPDISGLGVGTDWQSELFQTAPIYDNNLRFSGGTDKVVYSVSASDLRQEGIIGGDKTGFNRTTGRVSLGADMTDWLKFNSAITYSYIDRKSINDFGLGSVLFNAVNMPATVPVYDYNGNYYYAPDDVGIEIINPLQQIADTYNDYNLGKLTGNASLEARFAQHFTATGRIGVNTSQSKYKSFSKEVYYGEGKVFNNNRSNVYQSKENFNDYTFDLFVTYDNTFAEDHNISATLGNTVFKEWGNGLNATGYDVPYNSWEFADISLADGLATTKATGSYVYDQRKLSYFGRVQYDFKGKYLLSGMIRRDASTKFGPDNAVAWFPSTTVGWIASKEDFLKDMKNLNLLKIRASYGILGSDKINDYLYISQLTGEGVYVLGDSLTYGKAIGALPNPSVKWEQSEQIDIGFDLTMFKNKLEITADYFNKTTKDLLIPDIPVTGILGTSAPGAGRPTINAGTVRNSGFEFSVGYKGMVKNDFVYKVNYNVTYLNNEVLKVDNGIGYYEGGSFGVGQAYPARMEVGFPMGYFYGYETDGIFQTQAEVDAHPSQAALGAEAQPGDIRYKDLNGDGVINVNDKTMIGDPIPDFIMGLNISLDYKNFDFVTFFYASIGNDIVRNYERTQPNVNRLSYLLDRWTGAGTSDEVPRVTTAATANTVFSDYYVEDGSYLRIQRVQLGYTIGDQISEKIGFKELRFFVAITNLVTFTKYMGFDPAASSGSPIGSGFDSGFYPAARTYTFGLNLNI
ncbi:MAG TPA: TonB-dependent receptor [Bacteroidales bacterium]|nr:TonB-dependent receptor [Bacteroidales bacterium]